MLKCLQPPRSNWHQESLGPRPRRIRSPRFPGDGSMGTFMDTLLSLFIFTKLTLLATR